MVRDRFQGLDSIEPAPCKHNDWDDVRTRKGYKVLRCRECQGRWKINSSKVPRCMPFLHDCCLKGVGCRMLHVRRKKTPIEERHEKFGDTVLERVGSELQEKIVGRPLTPRSSADSDDPWSAASFDPSSSASDVSAPDSTLNPYFLCFAPPDAPANVGWVLKEW